MTRRPLLLTLPLLVVAAATAPAAAGTSAGDPCGDTEPMVRLGSVQEQPRGSRNDAFDIRSYALDDIVEGDVAVGTVVALELCGDVPGPDLPGTSWSVSWRLDDRCRGAVSVSDTAVRPPVAPARIALLSKDCSEPGPSTPLGGASSTTEVVYGVQLPAGAWSVDGRRIVWELRRDADLGHGAEQVVAGAVLAAPAARTRDGRQLTQAEIGTARASGPGTEDVATGAGDHRVG